MANLSWVAEKATGILIPSGYKAGTLYGIVPDNQYATGIPKDAFDFTFARSSIATRTNEAELIETMANDVPRLQYPSCPSCLLEPTRTNLALWSEKIEMSTPEGTSVSANAAISPDGLSTADEMIEDTSDGSHYVDTLYHQLTAGEVYCVSSFFKPNSTRNMALVGGSVGYGVNGVSYHADGTFERVINTVLDYGIVAYKNGWYRIWFTVSAIATGNGRFSIRLAVDGTTSYQGDGVSSHYVWGLMSEQGTYPTTYIKTEAATANRAFDDMTLSGLQTNGILGATEGTLFYNCSVLYGQTNSDNSYLTISDGTNSNRLILQFHNTFIRTFQTVGGTTKGIDSNVVYNANQLYKIAIKYSATEYALFVNGVKFTGTSPGTFAFPRFKGAAADGVANFFHGNIAEIDMCPTALTDAQLIELTT